MNPSTKKESTLIQSTSNKTLNILTASITFCYISIHMPSFKFVLSTQFELNHLHGGLNFKQIFKLYYLLQSVIMDNFFLILHKCSLQPCSRGSLTEAFQKMQTLSNKPVLQYIQSQKFYVKIIDKNIRIRYIRVCIQSI